MNTKLLLTITFILMLVAGAVSQRPRPGGPPPPPPGDAPRVPDWMMGVDTNRNGMVETDEFRTARDRTFTSMDRNGNGIIEPNEVPRPPKGDRMGPPGMPGQRPEGPPMVSGGDRNGKAPGMRKAPRDDNEGKLPPFFFMDQLRDGGTLSKADFERAANEVFASMDANNDGAISREESRPPNAPDGPMGAPPPPPPNAMFIGAELRFGDKLVKGQPFSADIVIEDIRRLYDGTTVTKKTQGATYRDGSGRTRREQPLENIGGFNIVNENNKPQTLVFINDFDTNVQYFLDTGNKVARKHDLGRRAPRDEPQEPADARSESLGTKTIEGVTAEGTRTTFEIPAGHIGNGSPIQVVTEKWYSAELQVTVMSRHVDPLSGEHIFRLTNIKRTEPAASLFSVPADYLIEAPGAPRPGRQ